MARPSLSFNVIGTTMARPKLFYAALGASQVLLILAGVLVCVWMGVYGKMGVWSDGLQVEFSSHPILMIFGLIIFYTEAILIYRVFPSREKLTLKIIHAILQGCAVIMVSVALKAIFDTHNLASPPKANLCTFHSWVGISTVGLFCCQFVFGFTGFLWPGFTARYRATYLSIHVFFGSAIFLMAIAAALLGIAENAAFKIDNYYVKTPPAAIVAHSLGFTLLLLAGAVMYLVINPDYKRDAQIKNVKENEEIIPQDTSMKK